MSSWALVRYLGQTSAERIRVKHMTWRILVSSYQVSHKTLGSTITFNFSIFTPPITILLGVSLTPDRFNRMQ